MKETCALLLQTETIELKFCVLSILLGQVATTEVHHDSKKEKNHVVPNEQV